MNRLLRYYPNPPVAFTLSQHTTRDTLGVAGDHHRPNAHGLELAQRLARLGPNDVGKRDRPQQHIVREHEDNGLALRCQFWTSSLIERPSSFI